MKPAVFLVLLTLLSGLCSCSRGSMINHSTGIAYEVIVVMDQDFWDSATGTAVMEELTTPVPYLLQEESSMKCIHRNEEQFGRLYRYVRNILIVNIDKDMYTKATLLKETDKWAKEQLVLYLNAPDGKMIEDYLEENRGLILEQFNKEEMRRARDLLSKSYSTPVMEKAKEKFGITINVPSDISSQFGNVGDALWFSNDAVTGRMDILIYSFPYTDNNTFTLEYMTAKRDSVAKSMIHGAFEGSYMSTEKRVVDYFSSNLNGKYCGILRGLWRMEGGDMMGGPFVSYARVDEQNQRVIVTEGFVFEPRVEKKKYIRRLEAALQTTRFNNEQEEVLAYSDYKKE